MSDIIRLVVIRLERGKGSVARSLQALQIQGDIRLTTCHIHDFYDDLACRFIQHRSGIYPILSGYGCARHLGEEHVGTLVAGKKLLHVIRSRPIGVMRIEPNQVGSPLPSLYMREEGRISSQTNHIGIALITRHDSSLTQSGCEAVF